MQSKDEIERSGSAIDLDLIFKKSKKFVKDVGTYLPDFNFVFGNFMGFVQGANMGSGVRLSSPAATGLVLGLNYIDAFANLIKATNLLLDESQHQQVQNKIKASLMIFSSVQLMTLSYAPWMTGLGIASLGSATVSATVLAAPAFAVATAIDLGLAAMDCYYAAKEVTFEGWLDEHVKEWNHLQNEIDKVQKKSKEVNRWANIQENFSPTQSALQNKLDELKNRQRELYENIQVRCWTHHTETALIKSRLGDMDKFFDYKYKNNNLPNQSHFHQQFNPVYSSTELDLGSSFSPEFNCSDYAQMCQEREDNIQAGLNDNYEKKQELLLIKSLSFIGCSLLAVASFSGPAAPALLAAGAVICAAVLFYYIYTKRDAIENTFDALYNSVNNLFVTEAEKNAEDIQNLSLGF